jgi:transposase-like protein
MDTPKKRPGGWRYIKKAGLDAARRAAVTLRIQAADEHILGTRTMEELAAAHGVAVGTIRAWVQARKRTLTPRRDSVVVEQQFERHAPSRVYDITQGSGGRMRDDEVRDATRALGRAIVALQAQLGQPTFDYRGRI